MLKKQIEKAFSFVKSGNLSIELPNGDFIEIVGEACSDSSLSAKMMICDWRVLSKVLFKGGIGFAESYIEKKIETPCLRSLLFLLCLNLDQSSKKRSLLLKPFQNFERIKYLLNRNSLAQSRKNIASHYDLGNEFYKLWLDPTMTYSSGYFINKDDNLEQAQKNKYSRILGQLHKNQNTLEIGCGWGGFSEMAGYQGFPITSLTISKKQFDYTQDRMRIFNPDTRPNICLKDYRLEGGKYKNIVSIEMFEAVGKRYWNTYFKKLKSCLATDGVAVIQTITIQDELFEKYKRSADFIRSYVFPGGFLPSDKVFSEYVHKNQLDINDRFFFGQDYAKTLDFWYEKFLEKKQQLLNLKYDDTFQRLWLYYLAYCRAGFKQGTINVCQYSLVHK